VAFLDAGSKVLSDLAHQVVNLGQNKRVTVKVQEPARRGTSPPPTLYEGCLLTSLDFPLITVGTANPLTETVTFQPTSKRKVLVKSRSSLRRPVRRLR
jgi:hypothetical protein